MPLEDLTGSDKFLSALNTAWPTDDDDMPEGDDHIRGVKNVLINQFGASAAATPIDEMVAWNTPAASQAKETGSLPMARGSTAQRPAAPGAGDWRYNSTTGGVEEWNGSAWINLFMRTDLENVLTAIQRFNVGDALADPNTVPQVWFSENGTQETAASVRGTVETDATNGRLELRRRRAGTFETVVDISGLNDNLDFENCSAYTIEGEDILAARYQEVTHDLVNGDEGSRVSLPHTLGGMPQLGQLLFRCKTANNNWGVGDEIVVNSLNGSQAGGQGTNTALWAFELAASNMHVIVGDAASDTQLPNRSTGARFSMQLNQWTLVGRVWRFMGPKWP